MSTYIDKNWKSHEVIFKDALNRIEQGIMDAHNGIADIENKLDVPELSTENIFTNLPLLAGTSQESQLVVVSGANLTAIAVENVDSSATVDVEIYINFIDGGSFNTLPDAVFTLGPGTQRSARMPVDFYGLKVRVINTSAYDTTINGVVNTIWKRFDVNGVNVYNSERLDGSTLSDIQDEIADRVALHAGSAASHGVTGRIIGTELINVPNGIAGLDENSKLTANQIPTIDEEMLALPLRNKIRTVESYFDPTVNDDANDGFSIGSHWMNISDDCLFVCVDNSIGAAIWMEVANASQLFSGIFNDLMDKPTAYPPEIHDHNGVYEPVFSKNTAFNKNFGTTPDTVCQGDDNRLSDTRMPTIHGNDRHSVDYATDSDLSAHVSDINNPHAVTKLQVGLSNVTNDAQLKRSELGVANGVPELDANGKVPLAQLPDVTKLQTYIVTVYEDLALITNIQAGEKGFVLSGDKAGNSYIYTGTEWHILADASWENVNLDWTNLINRPLTYTPTAHGDEAHTISYAQQTGIYPNLRAQATTKEDVELGNVLNKEQLGVNEKAADSYLLDGNTLEQVRAGVTKSDVGLANVTNDAQVPISEKDVAGGVAALDVSGYIVAPGAYLALTRDGSNDIHIRERTSGETALYLNRSGTDSYKAYLRSSAAWLELGTNEWKAVGVVDCNDLLTPGVYSVNSDSTNKPSTDWCSIWVSYISHNQWMQQLAVCQSGAVFVRRSYDSSGTRVWDSWKQLYAGIVSVANDLYMNDTVIYKSYNGSDVYQNKPSYATWSNSVWSTVGGPYSATLVGSVPMAATPDGTVRLRVTVSGGNVSSTSIFQLVVNSVVVATGNLYTGGTITYDVNYTDSVSIKASGRRGGTASTHTIGIAVLCAKANKLII